MALIQEMAVKIDQDFLAALLALFTPVTDTQADRQKVKPGIMVVWGLCSPSYWNRRQDFIVRYRCFVLLQNSTCL